MSKMVSVRLDEGLIERMDEAAGDRGRGKFISDAIEAALGIPEARDRIAAPLIRTGVTVAPPNATAEMVREIDDPEEIVRARVSASVLSDGPVRERRVRRNPYVPAPVELAGQKVHPKCAELFEWLRGEEKAYSARSAAEALGWPGLLFDRTLLELLRRKLVVVEDGVLRACDGGGDGESV